MGVGRWTLFIDEQKDAGRVVGLGALCVWRDVAPQFRAHLVADKATLEKTKGHVGHLHWSSFKERRELLAPLWLKRFFDGPLMFFLYLPRPEGAMRIELVKELVLHLERSPRVRCGLDRSWATVVLDFDQQDDGLVETALVDRFGLQDAYMDDDRDEPLLQLADVLLGMSAESHTGRLPPPSKADARREVVRTMARSTATKQAQPDSSKRNWIAALKRDGTIRRLLVDDAGSGGTQTSMPPRVA